MPRVTPTRVLKVLTLPWIVLWGLWLFLPSPDRSSSTADQYIQSALVSGGTLTTVHRWHRSFAEPAPNGHIQSPSDGCSGLIIDWRLVSQPDRDSTSLQIGLDTVYNLTSALLRASRDLNGQFLPHLSGPVRARIGVGDEDSIINMPWFSWQDQALFHHHMHGFDYPISLRIYVPSPNRVEVWKDSTMWASFPSIDLRDSDREFSLLAAFSNVGTVKHARSSIAPVKTSDFKGKLPSRTYPIRRLILGPLAPVASIGFVVLFAVVFPILTPVVLVTSIYVAVVLVLWAYHGFPVFTGWASTFWLTRCFFGRRSSRKDTRTRIWGPSGPIYDDGDDEFTKTSWRARQNAPRSMSERVRISLFEPPRSYGRDDKRSDIKAGRYGV